MLCTNSVSVLCTLQVRRLERMTAGGEGASQEYLKNVVLNYMLSTDIASRNHMLKVQSTGKTMSVMCIWYLLRRVERYIVCIISHHITYHVISCP